MGNGMARRLMARGHAVAGYDLSPKQVQQLSEVGGRGVASLEALVETLAPPRNLWVMVPHGAPTRQTIGLLRELVEPGDLIIDGGNSRFTASIEHAELCREGGILFLDIGVSGGVWGEERGFNFMVGGPEAAYRRVEPLLQALASADGYARVGDNGAGHFVKMVHNAIEYAMLQALGEGFEALHRSEFELDLGGIAELWLHGSVIRSWLLELLSQAFAEEGNELGRIYDWVDDSGMGRWTVQHAVDQALPLPVITSALFERFASREEERFRAKVIAALRNQFGGHAVRQSEG